MIETHVTIDGHSRIDFDRKRMRKAMRKVGADVRKQARRLVARRAISEAGQNPGRDTGVLWRSIKATVSKSGFMVKIRPEKTTEMGADFYPAYLHYGVRGRIDPRANYMETALEQRRAAAQSAIRSALFDSLIPRK